MDETDTPSHVAALEWDVKHTEKALTQLEARLDAHFDRIEQRIERIEQRTEAVNDRLDRLLHWAMVFILVSGFAGTGLVLAIGLRQL